MASYPGNPQAGPFESPPHDSSFQRLGLLVRVAFVWAALIVLRLLYLQIFSHSEYKQQAQSQQEMLVEMPAPRGDILDREGAPLARSVQAKSIVVNPMLVPDPALTAEVLARILKVDRQDLLGRLKQAQQDGRGFLWVKRKVTTEEFARVEALKLAGVEFRDDAVRYYPKDQLAAHVIGSVDHEEKGNSGVELGLQEELEGIPGTARLLTDVKRRGYESRTEAAAHPGKSITLTIDERIQHVVERELKAAVDGCHCKTGSVVILAPRTGDVLAMANFPTFNPNEPPDPKKDLSARLNLAVAAPYEPGSVFKVITLASALETTRLGPDSPINCMGGTLSLFGRVIHEAKGGFGVIPMRTVLAKSSNIGAIQVGLTVGPKQLHSYIRKFGFGDRTGIPMPAESGGQVHALRKWGKTSIGSVAMGHEIMTTTLQLAQAAAVVANDGLMVRPRLVLKRERPGEPPEWEPLREPVRVIRPESAAQMRRMMKEVVQKGGTGVAAKVPGYTTGGKTGSAQMIDPKSHKYLHGRYNASFMGMAPLNQPAIVVVVTLIGSSQYGGAVAAPVFQKVAAAALRILEVPKDDTDDLLAETPEPGDIANDVAVADLGMTLEDEPTGRPEEPVTMAALTEGPRVPNFVGKSLREVLTQAAEEGVQVEPLGRGVSRAQQPVPGSALQPGQRIVVKFGR